MYCQKCGNYMPDAAVFCGKCGNTIANIENAAIKATGNKTDKTRKRSGIGVKIAIIIGLSILILGLGSLIAYMIFTDSNPFVQMADNGDSEYEGYLEKAEECMEQEDYEGALKYYKAAIEIEVDSPEAYDGMAQVYFEMGETKEAKKTLKEGIKQTDSKSLEERLELLEEKGEVSPWEVEIKSEGKSGGKSGGKETVEVESEEFAGPRTPIEIEVRQVDNSMFPEVTIYASITDEGGEVVENLKQKDFDISEIDKDGNVIDVSIDDMYQVLNEDNISIELVMDASGSMDTSNKMQQAKNAACSLVEAMNLTGGDQIEVISFDDFVYLQQPFTSQRSELTYAITNISTGDMTALYDGIYAGLYQTNLERGAKCVIAFTDGMENASSYSFDDVVNMAKSTGIPVFIVGIGGYGDVDAASLENLALQCSGKYYSADDNNLESILEDIYLSIYKEQQNYYVFKYTTTNKENLSDFRNIQLTTSKASEYEGRYEKEYVPQTDITGAFGDYSQKDEILDFSSDREVTASDLQGLTLAELRIARNEIYARHGRQFKDPLLNQWFYSKSWYLNIPMKYSPGDFDRHQSGTMSRLEQQNANFILDYENARMNQEDIYPNASYELLSEYDLALSKPNLKKALAQMKGYYSTDILKENIAMVQDAIAADEVDY